MNNGPFDIGPRLGAYVERMVESYNADERTRHIDRIAIPNRAEIIEFLKTLIELLFPGFIGRQGLTRHNIAFHVGELMPRLAELAYHQIHSCLCYAQEVEHHQSPGPGCCAAQAAETAYGFLDGLPQLRERLAGDVQAAYDGDPAAENVDEVILAYPGLLAITVQRAAHMLYELNIPLLPRIMSEWAHAKTGIDIHPGAKIGTNFFIDHGTGVVIGETSEIGDYVKIYQGVTLGALSFPKDERGRLIRGVKRHPTVKDRVTIYANAIILGGETVIGENAVIGGSVFITSSVPANSVVTFSPPELRLRTRDTRRTDGKPAAQPVEKHEFMPDYVI